MGALIGLGVGAGVLLIWWSISFPRGVDSEVRPPRRLAQLLSRAGMGSVSTTSVLAASAALALVGFAVIQVVSGAAPVALAFGCWSGYLPLAVVGSRARRRQREFAQVWPDAVDNLVSAVRSGMSLPDALGALGERGPQPLRPAFAGFALDYQVTGRFGDSLDALKERLADPVGDRVVEGLRVAREVGGGDLGRLLRNLSGFLRDDERTRSEMEARQAWTVNGARLAVAAPWLVLLMLCFQSDVIQRYASPLGAVILASGALTCVLAYRLMLRIGQLPRDRRILS